jgi:hypothetical protein
VEAWPGAALESDRYLKRGTRKAFAVTSPRRTIFESIAFQENKDKLKYHRDSAGAFHYARAVIASERSMWTWRVLSLYWLHSPLNSSPRAVWALFQF